MSARPANQRAQPREHFLDPKRLRDVVVRAAVDALHLLVPAAARREHEHRHRQARVAPAAKQRQAVDPREPEIEEHRVVGLGSHRKVRPLAVGGGSTA